jgi:cytochrome b pre-mRNA-processing protein 3
VDQPVTGQTLHVGNSSDSEVLAKLRKTLMLWPFNRSRTGSGSTIEAIYGMIVAQARLPAFYQQFQVPDTVNGRFDMVLLHLWLVLRRLRANSEATELTQALLDRFCSDMDDNLREMGVGDLSVPKRMLKFAEAFYGRTAAYDAALKAGGSELALALARNVLLTSDAAPAAPLAAYVQEATRGLDAIDDKRLLAGEWTFAAPKVPAETQEQVT